MSLFVSVFQAMVKFLDMQTSPLGVYFHEHGRVVGATSLRQVLFMRCVECRGELGDKCFDGCRKGQFDIVTKIKNATEDGAFYCDHVNGRTRVIENPKSFDDPFYDLFDDVKNATGDDAFYRDRVNGCTRDIEGYESVADFYDDLPGSVKSQLYVRKLLAQSLRPLTLEMCRENADAAIVINELLSLPNAIYNKSEMQTFRGSVAKLQKIIDAYFAPGSTLVDQLVATWEEKSAKNDSSDSADTAVTAESKKRKKK